MEVEKERQYHPVEALKARKILEDILPQTTAKSCGMAVLNFMKKRNFESPRFYLHTGELYVRPPVDEKITSDMAAITVAQKSSWAMHGTSGVLCFDVEHPRGDSHQITLAVLWSVPLSETLYSNQFNVRVVPRSMRCDEKLFNLLSENIRNAGDVIEEEQEGITIRADMSKDPRSILYVECRTPEEAPIWPLTKTEPIRAGKDLQDRCREWLGECEAKNCCAIGIDNWSSRTLTNPKIYMDSGHVVYELPERVESKMAGATLTKKKDYSLSGTAGLLAYDIEEGREEGKVKARLAIMWQVPFTSGVVLQNSFNVRTIPPNEEVDENLFDQLKHNARLAKDGPFKTSDAHGYLIHVQMGVEPKSMLTVCFSDKTE